MCGTENSTRLIDNPETTLAHHLEECTGVHIDPENLRRFLCENWRTVSVLAHRIHDDGRRKDRNRLGEGGVHGA